MLLALAAETARSLWLSAMVSAWLTAAAVNHEGGEAYVRFGSPEYGKLSLVPTRNTFWCEVVFWPGE